MSLQTGNTDPYAISTKGVSQVTPPVAPIEPTSVIPTYVAAPKKQPVITSSQANGKINIIQNTPSGQAGPDYSTIRVQDTPTSSVSGLNPGITGNQKDNFDNLISAGYILGNDGILRGPSVKDPTDSSTSTSGTGAPSFDTSGGKTDNLNTYSNSINTLMDQATKSYNDYINSKATIMAGGAMTDADKSLLSAIQKTYEGAIAKQEIANKSNEGITAEFSNRLGLNVGSPLQALGYMNNTIAQGTAMITDIQTKEQSALSKAKQAIIDGELKIANDNYNAYIELNKEKSKAITDLYDKTSAAAKEIRDYNLAVQKQKNDDEQLKLQKIKSDQDAKRLASDLSTDAAQRAKLYADISKTKAEIDQMKNTLAPKVQTAVTSISNKFDSNQIVKDYNTVASQKSYLATLGNTPSDDQARIYAFAKVMDPNSAVREGEYKTVQAYSQALLQHYGIKATRIFNNEGILTDQARKFLLDTIEKKEQSLKKSYDNLRSEEGRKINMLTKKDNGEDYLVDYSQTFENASNNTQDPNKDYQAALNDPTYSTLVDQALVKYPNDPIENILQVIGYPGYK